MYMDGYHKTLKILRQKKKTKPFSNQSTFFAIWLGLFSVEDSYRMEPLQLNYLQARFTVSFEKIKAVLEERKCPLGLQCVCGSLSEASFTLCFWGLSCCLWQFGSHGFKESTSPSITCRGQLGPVVCVVGSLWWSPHPHERRLFSLLPWFGKEWASNRLVCGLLIESEGAFLGYI